jgi:hypothetical protein
MKDLKADFGAVGDGVTDDTAAVQAALSWVASARSSLSIPESTGFYAIYAPLIVQQGASFGVFGPHKQGTADYRTGLIWKGAAGVSMLTLDGCRDSEWKDFALDAGNNAAIEPAVLLDIDKLTVGSWNSRKNTFGGMLLRGGSTATVRISNVTGVNNEANIFDQCAVMSIPGSIWTPGLGNAGPSGFQVKHVNAKANIIRNCEISGKAYAVDIVDGSFRVRDTEFSGCGTWVRNAGRGEPSVIDGCDGDSSRTFLETGLTQTSPVIASGNRCQQGYNGPLFVFGDTMGPVTLLNNEFANGGYKAPADCYTSIPGNGPILTAIGNTFPNDQILPVPALQTAKLRALYSMGNVYYGPGNTRHFLPDNLVPNRNTGQQVASLRIGGASGFSGDVQSINIATLQINPNQPTVFLSATANHSLTSVPTFRPGMFDGQEVKLVNIGNFNVGLIDRNTLAGSALSLVTPTVLIPPRGSVSLTWYFNAWYQTSPVLSPL